MKNADKAAYPSTDTKKGSGWSAPEGETNQEPSYKPGLTKREVFAMAAMQGMCANSTNGVQDMTASIIAKSAIKVADELLKQLEN